MGLQQKYKSHLYENNSEVLHETGVWSLLNTSDTEMCIPLQIFNHYYKYIFLHLTTQQAICWIYKNKWREKYNYFIHEIRNELYQ